MTYIIILVVVIFGIYLLNFFAKKSATPENIITYFLQELEVKALEYAIDNGWPEELSKDNLDKTLLVTSGYFFSLGKSNELKLEYDEIVTLAEYATESKPVEKTISGGVDKDNRCIFFIVLYKLALIIKEKGEPISLQKNSAFMSELDDFNDIDIRKTYNRHMRDGEAPLGHKVLTKNLVKRYPKWHQMKFD